jgi:hypothetical protein
MMSSTPSVAERLDRAVDLLIHGSPPAAAAAAAGLDAPRRPLVEGAAVLRRSLPLPSVAPRFEARLGARLAMPGAGRPDLLPVGWARRHPGRLIVTGAVGSAVGVGVTAYAVWRSSRRAAPRFRHW